MKNIVITGASRGVGALLAKGLAKEGNRIICLGRSEQDLVKVVKDINLAGGKANYLIVDMMEDEQVATAGNTITEKYGSIDVWINNVGVNNHNAIGPTWEIKSEHWWREVSLNLYTAFIGSQTAIRLMKGKNKGYIFNLGGGGVQKAKPFVSAYSTAKTAIVRFTEALNIELEQEGLSIKVFAFNPGFIRNTRTEELVESDVARKYMPKLEQILKFGEMSNIQDSIDLITALSSGRADKLGGKYFLADDRNIEQAIANDEDYIEKEKLFLRVR